MESREADVIVIGAGMSGLIAAKKLQELSSSLTVIVLEARDRLGGRIHTIETENMGAVDMGAAWIHGHSNKNPISQLVKQMMNDEQDASTTTASNPFKQDWDNMTAYDTDGPKAKVIPNRTVFRAWKQHDKLIKQAQRLLEEESDDISLEAAIQRVNPDALQDPMMGYILATMEEGDFGACLDDLSTWWFNNDKEFPGQDALMASSGGYVTLIDYVARGLDVRTNTQVESIHYSSEKAKRVQIGTDQGTFTARYCIVTLPLGVLKADTIRFQPVLPLPKRNAIQSVGFGKTAKVVLVFSKPFWPRKTQLFASISESRTNSRERGKFPTFVNLYPVTGRPVLVVHAEGRYVKDEMEQLDDKTIVLQVMKTVRSMFGNECTLEPIETFVTRWGTDPYSRGTYSYHAVGQKDRAWIDLSESVDDVLFFAGEHCSKRYRGTVHGAYLSGERAADHVYQQLISET